MQPTLRQVGESKENARAEARAKQGLDLFVLIGEGTVQQGHKAPDDHDDRKDAHKPLEHDGQGDGEGVGIPGKHSVTSLQQIFNEGDDETAGDNGSDLTGNIGACRMHEKEVLRTKIIKGRKTNILPLISMILPKSRGRNKVNISKIMSEVIVNFDEIHAVYR